jgi:hypothetical protein
MRGERFLSAFPRISNIVDPPLTTQAFICSPVAGLPVRPSAGHPACTSVHRIEIWIVGIGEAGHGYAPHGERRWRTIRGLYASYLRERSAFAVFQFLVALRTICGRRSLPLLLARHCHAERQAASSLSSSVNRIRAILIVYVAAPRSSSLEQALGVVADGTQPRRFSHAKSGRLGAGWDPGRSGVVGWGQCFAFRSRASRSAVRFFAAASDAFLARAERSVAVMFLAAVLPPFAPIAAIACRSTSRVSLAIPR